MRTLELQKKEIERLKKLVKAKLLIVYKLSVDKTLDSQTIVFDINSASGAAYLRYLDINACHKFGCAYLVPWASCKEYNDICCFYKNTIDTLNFWIKTLQN